MQPEARRKPTQQRPRAFDRVRVTRQPRSIPVDTPRIDPMRLAMTASSCAVFDALPEQSVGVTYWFDAATTNAVHSRQVRLSGELLQPREGAPVNAGARTAFSTVDVVPEVPSGAGRVAVTMRIRDLAPGLWHVIAAVEADASFASTGESGGSSIVAEAAPGVRLGAWALFVAMGAVAGVSLLAVLGARTGVPALPLVTAAVVACLLGLPGAKAYFRMQSPIRSSWLSSGGMCIQGFVLVALTTLVVSTSVLPITPLRLLDLVSAPLLLGIAVGRVGCFRAGCCAGRITGGRLALWSSDRHLGARRIPTQLFEGVGSLAIGAVAVAMLLGERTMPAGSLALQSLAAYVLLRQALLPYRALPRRQGWQRPATAALSALGVTAALTAMLAAA